MRTSLLRTLLTGTCISIILLLTIPNVNKNISAIMYDWLETQGACIINRPPTIYSLLSNSIWIYEPLHVTEPTHPARWSWHAESTSIHTSLIQTIMQQKAPLSIVFDEWNGESVIDENGNIPLVTYLMSLATSTQQSAPYIVEHIHINTGTLNLHTHDHYVHSTLTYRTDLDFSNQRTALTATDIQGTISINKGTTKHRIQISNGTARFWCYYNNPADTGWHGNITCQATLNDNRKPLCITIDWYNQDGTITVKRNGISLPIQLTYDNNEIHAHSSINGTIIATLLGYAPDHSLAMIPNLDITAHYNHANNLINCTCVYNEYKKNAPLIITATAHTDDEIGTCTACLHTAQNRYLSATLSYAYQKDILTITTQNETTCAHPLLGTVAPAGFIGAGTVTPTDCRLEYLITPHANAPISSGIASYSRTQKRGYMHGTLGSTKYHGTVTTDTTGTIIPSFTWHTTTNIPLITGASDTHDPHIHTIAIHYAQLLDLLYPNINFFDRTKIHPPCMLRVQQDADNIHGDITIRESAIPFCCGYNRITTGTGTWEYDSTLHMIKIPHVLAHCITGTIMINNSTITLPHSKNISFNWAIPMTINRCSFNVGDTIFGLFSGALYVEGTNAAVSSIKGALMLDRTNAKINLFCPEIYRTYHTQSSLLLPDIPVSCSLETGHPIQIHTPVLKATAYVYGNITGSLAHPCLSGGIETLSGSLMFPAHPLTISHSIVQFNGKTGLPTTIELTAEKIIKNHRITLHTSGPITDPEITVNATPFLSPEEIMGLLLVGSPHATPAVVAPSALMEQVKEVILTDENICLEPLPVNKPSPLDVHISPFFTDHTARGGVRAGIEVTVNDKWRALIQKNFTLTEDTRFELEYMYSPTVSTRFIRDERRDFGAEIEFRKTYKPHKKSRMSRIKTQQHKKSALPT